MRIRTLAQTVLAGLLLAATAQAQTITVMGSTALGPVMKKAADDFMKSHPGVQIAVTGGGSMTGLNQVASGGCHIGISDVFATPEQEKAGLKNHNIVVQPFTLVAHPGLGVKSLTSQQAEDIFTGKVNNWKEVGGPDRKIVRVIRPESSGTRAVQKLVVLHNKEFSKDVLIQDSTGAVVTAVATTPGAVSFVELEHLEKNKTRIAGIAYNQVECTNENVKSGKYTIFSYGHAYTHPTKLSDPKVKEAVERFLAHVLSPEFQQNVVLKAGYLPVDYVKSLKAKL